MGVDGKCGFYSLKCPLCGTIQVKEIRKEITESIIRCCRCEKSLKIYNKRSGKFNLDIHGAFPGDLASKFTVEWKTEGRIPEWVDYSIKLDKYTGEN